MQTGRGQQTEVSLTNAMVSMLSYIATNYFASGTVPPRSGNDHPIAAPYGLFATRDGEIAIAPPDVSPRPSRRRARSPSRS